LLTITVNNTNHLLPDGWHELPFADIEKASAISGDLLYDLCGLPAEVAMLLPEQDQRKIAQRLMAFREMPMFDVPTINVASWPFGDYVKCSDLQSDRLGFLKVRFPNVSGYCHDCLPLYLAMIEAWKQWHEQWKWLETQPDSKWVKAGIKDMVKYGVYGLVAELAHGDILKEEQLMTLETSHVFIHRAYHKDKAKIESTFVEQSKNKP
jgi:hypothetical protein